MGKSFTLKQKFLLFVASFLGPFIIRLIGSTWKVRYECEPELNQCRAKYGKMIFCFWHNRILSLCYTHRKRNVGILISTHFDGEIIARIVQRMGYHPIRGSSTKMGATGLFGMLKYDKAKDLAITVDGPKGPRGMVKPGVIFLAAKSGLPIIPVSCNSSKKWVLSSWDRFQIPKPFAEVVVQYGHPICLENNLGHTQVKNHSHNLADALNGMESCT
jgi:lysophospholipid acyltransferase (LPLAT)-like uncharacterized protein